MGIRNVDALVDENVVKTNDKCGRIWYAPLVAQNPKNNSVVKQTCIRPKGHTDDHRSITKVTKPNKVS